MSLFQDSASRVLRSRRTGCLLATIIAFGLWPPAPGRADDTTRAEKIAAELNIPRRAWTICTVNELGLAVEAEQTADAPAIADRALARCSGDEQALRAKATELLGGDAAGRLMARLETEARDALIGSARTLQAAKAAGGKVDPAWPRVVAPSH